MDKILFGHENDFLGKTLYMAIGRRVGEKLKIFDMGNENVPRLEQDYFALCYFQNLSDLMLVTVSV